MKKRKSAAAPDDMIDDIFVDPDVLHETSFISGGTFISASKIYAGTIDASCFIAQNKTQPTIEYLPKPTNCKNCGAVLHGRTCEYCGTEYLERNKA